MSPTREWSLQQKSIFAWFANDPDYQDVLQVAVDITARHLVVRARAGTGKTTTILEAINFAPDGSILLAAFNKKIAEELKTRVKNPKAKAQTLHSVGVSFLYRHWKNATLDEDRSARHARKICGQNAPDAVINIVRRLAALGKNSYPINPAVEQMIDLIYQFDLEPEEYLEEEGWFADKLASCAIRVMDMAATDDGTFDFDDMIFVTVRNRWYYPKYDMVVIDEAQDMNPSQLLLAQGVCKKTGRIVVVGDNCQAIYGFRGADSESLDRLKRELTAQELGLTTTYRCGKKIVEYAQTLVPDFRAGPNNPEGEILSMDVEKMALAAESGDFVLSRKNAPLAKVCMKFLRMRKKARIEGKDIGNGLLSIIKKVKGRSIPDFLERLGKWEDKMVQRLQKVQKEAAKRRIEFIRDQAETLRVLAEDAKGISGEKDSLESRIAELFTYTPGGKPDCILCSSVHKSKGLEAERVFILRETLYPGGNQSTEEKNIEYVAVTRAKKTLVWVSGLS